ncbi:MAG TPA: SCP2 sterol-binding domain-containing protein, partial [Solirubrobacteraceae bacterium]|nr:SCP2 sterol-binding domain-containing protein [Solirubrobacteraceae bacterium]
ISDGHASARPGGTSDPKLKLRLQLADFVRVAAGLVDPAVPLLEGRASFEGDFALVAKLPEMFGAPSPY